MTIKPARLETDDEDAEPIDAGLAPTSATQRRFIPGQGGAAARLEAGMGRRIHIVTDEWDDGRVAATYAFTDFEAAREAMRGIANDSLGMEAGGCAEALARALAKIDAIEQAEGAPDSVRVAIGDGKVRLHTLPVDQAWRAEAPDGDTDAKRAGAGLAASLN